MIIGGNKQTVTDRTATITHDFIVGHEYEVVVRAIGPDGTAQPIENAARNTIVIQGKVTNPTTPSGLTAVGFINSIVLAWTNSTDHDFDVMEVWRSAMDDVGTAVKIAETRATHYTDAIGTENVTRYYWIRSRNTSNYYSFWWPQTDVGVGATTLGVVATDIADFAVTATKMFTKAIILTADSWTDNSPGAGSIAWNGHSVVYNGASYPITAGNTALAYVYWTIGATTYSASATHPTLGNTAFMIAINTAGIHTLVWNSSANMVIGTAFIADLAVTNAKINSLSASKLTAGTIDASVITVTKLNASNISTGTLSGRAVTVTATGGGTISLYPNAGTGLTVTNASAATVFWAQIGGVDDGDVTIGNYAGAKGCKWDNSAATFTVRGALNADDITAGTLTGRVVRTDTGAVGHYKRIELAVSDNTLRFYNSSNVNVVTIDDDLLSTGRPGMRADDATYGGAFLAYKDSINYSLLHHQGVYCLTDEAYTPYCPVYINDSYSTGTGQICFYITRLTSNTLSINTNGNIRTVGYSKASSGFRVDDSNVGLTSDSFTDADGNVFTIKGGLITAKT